MLTYSFSLNKPITIAPLIKIASAEIVNILWHANSSLLGESMGSFADWERDYEMFNLLKSHFEETISASQKFTEENNLPRIFKAFFKESICSLYQAYIEVLLWRKHYDERCEIELLDKNKPYAPNYFTVYGEFNDLAWVKRVVLHPDYPLDTRFFLACFYWLENESAILWSELKKSYLVPWNINPSYIYEEMYTITTLRIFQLEDQMEILAQNPEYAGNFYIAGFKKAADWTSEYATNYFWQNLAEQEKMKIIESDSFLHLFNRCAFSYPLDKISYFLYSQLSKEQRKKFFLEKTIEYDDRNQLVALLLSPYAKEVRSELIQFVHQLPFNLYSEILDDIACYIIGENFICFPLHIEVFEVLWNNLSFQERDKVLNNPKTYVKVLIEEKSFYNLNV